MNGHFDTGGPQSPPSKFDFAIVGIEFNRARGPNVGPRDVDRDRRRADCRGGEPLGESEAAAAGGFGISFAQRRIGCRFPSRFRSGSIASLHRVIQLSSGPPERLASICRRRPCPFVLARQAASDIALRDDLLRPQRLVCFAASGGWHRESELLRRGRSESSRSAATQLVSAEQAQKDKDGDDKLKQAVQAAQKKLDDAVKARDAAAAEAEKESEAYSPLGESYSKTTSGRRLAFAECQRAPPRQSTHRTCRPSTISGPDISAAGSVNSISTIAKSNLLGGL